MQQVNIYTEYSSLAMNGTTTGTGYVGKIIPIFVRELIPSQKVSISHKVGIQFMPMVSNVLHTFTGVIQTFFVPYRLLDDNWEDFIMGGISGNNSYELPFIDLKQLKENSAPEAENQTLVHTILDYMGYPINNDFQAIPEGDSTLPKPMAYPVWAYNKIYNDHIRPIDVQPEEVPQTNISCLQALWQFDYFTRARVYQQRGAVPIVPLENGTSANLNHVVNTILGPLQYNTNGQGTLYTNVATSPFADMQGYPSNAQFGTAINLRNEEGYIAQGRQIDRPNLDTRTGDLSTLRVSGLTQQIEDHVINLEGVGININSLYTQMGIMNVLINNAKIKYLYIDYLEQWFGVKRQDARLQMAEYISTENIDIGMSTITQTSYGDTASGQTPQGYITAQAGATGNVKNTYTCQEHGVLMSLLIITPATVYEGGLPRMLMTKSRFEFPLAPLVNMPDRPIYKGELYYTQSEQDTETFGYAGIFDEYRTIYNQVCGLLRPSTPVPAPGSTLSPGLYSYTLARYFTEAPSLNLDFLQCYPDMQRIMQYTEEPDFLFMIGHYMNTAIPLPMQSNPAELLNF